jgi:glycosyltransferase involved in cell wall biosynthesis
MSLKYIFVSFQGIQRGNPNGMVKLIIPIMEKLRAENEIKAEYFVSHIDGYDGDLNISAVSQLYTLFLRILQFLNKRILNLPVYVIRYIQEIVYDYFVCQRIDRAKVILSTAYLSRSYKRNTGYGGINIFIAGNPDDCEIYRVLKEEEKTYNIEIYDAYTYKRRVKFVEKSTNIADHIVTLSSSEHETYSKRFGENRISFVEHYIIPVASKFPERNIAKNSILTFCFVSHSFWLKGLFYLLKAWSSLEILNVQLKIIGRVDSQIEGHIKRIFPDIVGVNFTGWVDDLNIELRSSHVAIIPSILDAGPVTVAESMSCGLPVIVSTGCGASTLVLEGENGFTVPPRDAEAIVNKIKWFCENRARIKQMGDSSINIIKRLSLNNQSGTAVNHLIHQIATLEKKGKK